MEDPVIGQDHRDSKALKVHPKGPNHFSISGPSTDRYLGEVSVMRRDEVPGRILLINHRANTSPLVLPDPHPHRAEITLSLLRILATMFC